MTEAGISVDQFICPVCLDLLKDPVAIPCGHNYCMSCITSCWDQEDQEGVYSCPQCRMIFTPRPVLYKNVVFAEMVEKLKKTNLQTAVPAHCHAESADVECDVCTGKKHEAVKSCLECLNSFCQNHLEQHENLFKGKRHNLMDSARRLQEMICHQHKKLLEVFCHTDQQCICMLYTMDEHRNHDNVSVAAERSKKQDLLGETQRKFKQRIQKREKDLQKLREAVESHQRSAQVAVKDSERIFTELIRSIERRRSEVTQLIRDQEKAAVGRAKGVLKRLEQEIAELKRRDTELEQLSHTEDHIYFRLIQHYCQFSPLFDDVRKSVSQLKEKLDNFSKEEIEQISYRVTYIEIIPNEPKTREEFLQYFHQFTLDPNTVYKTIRLSEGNRVATRIYTDQQYPDHLHRFHYYLQVLCGESVCERCYWEVEWSGSVFISVSYKSISRKGRGHECGFGFNNQSWSLICSPSNYSFIHNQIETKLPAVSSCFRIGVYVDHSAGTLSFYSISHTITLIHKVQTTFTQPLYPGFNVYNGSIKLCAVTI